MAKKIDFYFDFISPFSYLAHTKLPALAEKYGVTLNYHAMDIPKAKVAAGNYGPSNREVKPKIKVMLADLQRWAKRYDVPLEFPKSFDCERWNRAVSFAVKEGKAQQFVAAAYDQIWGKGIDASDDTILASIAAEVGLDDKALIAYVTSEEGEADFVAACEAAHETGVFGAPIMIVDDKEYFWGNDRFDFLEEFLQQN